MESGQSLPIHERSLVTGPFKTSRKAAVALINSDIRMTEKRPAFFRHLVGTDLSQMSPRQASWLATMLDEAGLPPHRIRVAR